MKNDFRKIVFIAFPALILLLLMGCQQVGGDDGDKKTVTNVWTLATKSADFSKRYGHTSVVFDDKIWVIGGFEDGKVLKNDVWYSVDGYTWIQVDVTNPFPPRYGHVSTVYDNKIWVIAGRDQNLLDDVWYSSDGKNWIQATANAAFTPRWFPSIAQSPRDDIPYMLIYGGFSTADFSQSLNDLFISADGINWTEYDSSDFTPLPKLAGASIIPVSETGDITIQEFWIHGGIDSENSTLHGQTAVYVEPPKQEYMRMNLTGTSDYYTKRYLHTSFKYNDTIWLIGGITSDGSYSEDVCFMDEKKQWVRFYASAQFSTRAGHTSVVFRDKMWVIGGWRYNSEENIYLNDVWWNEAK